MNSRRAQIASTIACAGVLPLICAAALAAVRPDGQFVDEQVHAFVEFAGGSMAVGVALLLGLRWRDPNAARHPLWVVAALFSMGLLDTVHGALPFGIAWSWTRHLATLMGGGLFAAVWIPIGGRVWRRRKLLVVSAVTISAALAAAVWKFPAFWPVPWATADYTFWPKAINALGGLGFLGSSLFFLRRFGRTGARDEIVFAGHTLLFGISALLFSVSRVWGPEWWLWHFFRLVAYLVVAGAGYQTVRQMHAELLRRKAELEKEVEQRVRASERTNSILRAISEHSVDLIYVKDQEGRMLLANPATCRVIGKSWEEIAGKTSLEWGGNTAETRAIIENDRSVLRQRQPQFLEELFTSPDGSQRLYHSSKTCWCDREGNPLGIIGVSRDITVGKQAEERVRQSEQHLRRVLDNLFSFVGVLTPDGTLLQANRAPLEAAGISSRDVLGKKFWDCYWWNYSAAVQSQLQQACAQAMAGEVVRYDVLVRMAGEARMWIDFQIAPLRDDAGQITHLIPSAMDITGRKEIEAALRQAHEQLANRAVQLERLVEQRTAKLQETIADLESFSYSIAHDLRAPLRAMSSFSAILLEEHQSKLDQEGAGFLRRIASAAKRMDDLIADVLTYSRVMRAEADLEPVLLEELVGEILDQYPQFSCEHADIVVDKPILPVIGNRALLTQCISNFIGNAVKFMAAGVKPHLRLWTESRDGQVRFCVQDNGIGMQPDQIDRIWRIFERLHPQNQYAGTGIGLSIVKRAVERMRGSVGVQSAVNQGSVFWFQLPAAHPHDPSSSSSS